MKQYLKKTNYLLGIFFLVFNSSVFSQSFTEGFENLANLTDWFVQNNSVSPDADWGGGSSTNFPAQAGTANSYLSVNFQSTSSAVGTTISNWLFTPTRTYNNGDVITFYSRTVTGPLYPDRMEVRFSSAGNGLDCGTTATSVGTFTTLLTTINPALTTTGYPQLWTQYTITISGLAAPTNGRVAFRYFVTNGGPAGTNSDLIGLDSYTYTSVAQPPVNNQCAGAIPLNQGTSCNPVNGTVAYATESQVACSGTANNDVWYSFTANTTGASITVNGSTAFDAVYEVFTGNCASLTSLSCIDAGVEGESESSVLNNLTIGQTYYIRVHDWLDDIPNTMTFGICVEQFTQCNLQQPFGSLTESETCGLDANGGCNSTPPVYQQITCGDTVFGSSWATGGNRDLDWYRFTLNSPGNVTLTAQAEFPYYIYLVDISNCANPVIVTSANYNACQNGTISYNFPTSGNYAAIIAPALFDGYACGNNTDYLLWLNLPPVQAQISSSSAGVCPNGTALLSGSPLANYSWNLNGSFFAAGQTTQISLPGSYSATYTDVNGCASGSNSIVIQSLPLDNSSFAYSTNTVCVGSPNVVPTTQNSGLFTANSSGIVFANTAAGEIDMTASQEGNYVITFQTNGTCPASSTQNFVITSNPDASFGYTSATYCQNTGNQQIQLGTNASIGVFSSNSGGLNLSASTGEIALNQSALGTFTIYNTISASGSCPEIVDSFVVEIQGPEVVFPNPGLFCPSDNLTPLTASPSGGIYSGTSIQNNEFNPALGSSLITYVVTDQNGCLDSASQLINVELPTNLTFGQYPDLCTNGSSITLNLGLPNGGTYSGVGVTGADFSPTQGVIGSNSLTYSYTSPNGCSDSVTGVIIVNEAPTISFDPISSICDTSSIISLGGVNPSGGIFSGTGIVNDSFFDPSIAGIGTHQITYTYTNNGCSSSASQNITVDECTSLFELSQTTQIYPNPVINTFSISGFNEIETIELYSMEGKLIQQIDNQNNNFDISHLSRSNYLVKFSANNQIFYMKLMKY
jgi:hypothetical protein